MTIGNETYESVKKIPVQEGTKIFFNFMQIVNTMMQNVTGGDSLINHEDLDDDFSQFLKNHQEAIKNK